MTDIDLREIARKYYNADQVGNRWHSQTSNEFFEKATDADPSIGDKKAFRAGRVGEFALLGIQQAAKNAVYDDQAQQKRREKRQAKDQSRGQAEFGEGLRSGRVARPLLMLVAAAGLRLLAVAQQLAGLALGPQADLHLVLCRVLDRLGDPVEDSGVGERIGVVYQFRARRRICKPVVDSLLRRPQLLADLVLGTPPRRQRQRDRPQRLLAVVAGGLMVGYNLP